MQDDDSSPSDTFDSPPILQRKWIRDQMKKRQRDFCEPTVFSIFCGSWNVNDKTLNEDKESLEDWLLPQDQFVADVFAIGFQETVELSTMNVVFDGSKSTDRALYWQRKISESFLLKGLMYSLIEERHMVGNLICVYAKTELIPFIRGVRGSSTPVGIMGVMGNKGAVVIRFRIHNTTVCLVCSHLSANRDNVVGRNNDFKNINEKTSLYPAISNAGLLLEASELATKDSQKDLSTQWANDTALPLLIEEHDVVLWFGDLNYRIHDAIPTAEVMEIVKRGGSASLLSRDQLHIEMEAKNVFEGYLEGPLEFDPTYKYQPGTDQYDCRPEKKLRAPAWCDRILWKENSATDSVRQLNYRRAELNISDHKPISALFNIDSGVTDPIRERSVYQDLLSKVDKWENASAPKLVVDDRVIDFGMVQMQEWKSHTMIVRNVGTVFSSWKFVPKFEDTTISLPWLNFYPLKGILAPGEEVEVTASLCVTSAHIEALLASTKSLSNIIPLEDMTIIRVTGGSDFFCIFSGLLNLPHTPLTLNDLAAAMTAQEGSMPLHHNTVNTSPIFIKQTNSTIGFNSSNGSNVNSDKSMSPLEKQFSSDTCTSSLSFATLNSELPNIENPMPVPPLKPPKSEKSMVIPSKTI